MPTLRERLFHRKKGETGGPRVLQPGNDAELLRLGTGDWVNAVTFSPDGTLLATAALDGTARVWDAATGAERFAFRQDGGVMAVAFSPDGARLVTGGMDHTARVYSVDTGTELLRLPGGGYLWAVAFSPDGAWLAAAGDDGTARVWDAASGAERLQAPHENVLWGVAFSPDGTRLATACMDGTAQVWEVATGVERLRVRHRDGLWGVAFSLDGTLLATCSHDHTAAIWDAATGAQRLVVRHDGAVVDVAFSPDGTRLLTGSMDGTARVWDAATGAEQVRVRHGGGWREGGRGEVRGVAFGPDGTRIATATKDGAASVFALVAPPEAAVPTQRVARETVQPGERFLEQDNRGTRQSTWAHAVAYWRTRMTMPRKAPFVMYVFSSRDDARAALLALPYIEVADDTGNLLCTKTLEYGYYEVPGGASAFGYHEGTPVFEALVCGFDLTHDEWQQARAVFAEHGGRLKNEQEPEAVSHDAARVPGQASEVRFVREDRRVGSAGVTNIYRVFEAPDADAAQLFLTEHPVPEPFHYLVVETPEGNYGRDNQGMYKE